MVNICSPIWSVMKYMGLESSPKLLGLWPKFVHPFGLLSIHWHTYSVTVFSSNIKNNFKKITPTLFFISTYTFNYLSFSSE